ncbi:MAG TPA: alcohol dehydrogenase catalytic domain-containing protein [Actinomycetota bacterium]
MTGERLMRAAVLRSANQPLTVEEVVLAPPGPGEVLVRVAAAGVCRSDVHLADGSLGDGRWPIVLGHEGAGVVEAVGPDVGSVAPGDPVAFCFVPSCGGCRQCVTGRRGLCEVAASASWAGTLLDGTSRLSFSGGEVIQHFNFVSCFAELAVMPVASAVPIPPGLPLAQAALLGCGVVTGFGAVRNAARVAPGDSVCVVGCGGVGLHVIAAARLAGADPLIAVDAREDKLRRATARGATHVFEAHGSQTTSQIRALTDGGADHAFEVVGRADTIRMAFDVLRAGATAVVVGIAPRGVEVPIPAQELLSEKGLRGSYYGSGDPAGDLAALARLVAAGEVDLDLDGVVSHVTDLDGVEEAFGRLRRGEGARTIVEM